MIIHNFVWLIVWLKANYVTEYTIFNVTDSGIREPSTISEGDLLLPRNTQTSLRPKAVRKGPIRNTQKSCYFISFADFFSRVALLVHTFNILSLLILEPGLLRSKIQKLSSKQNYIKFARIIVSVHATNYIFVILYVNGNAKSVVLLLNSMLYATLEYGRTNYASSKWNITLYASSKGVSLSFLRCHFRARR